VAVGASRKAFVRRFSGVGDDASASDRLPGSLAGVAAAVAAGASIVRVHDVEETVRFLRMLRAIAAPAPAPARAVETVR
jgi:dihydropteroate synthase